MFRNLVHIHDLVTFAEKIRGTPWFVSRLSPLSRRRTAAAWRHTGGAAPGWWDIPAVRERWNMLVTGSPDRSPVDHVLMRYLAGRRDLTMLSLGCGRGEKELEWMRSGCIQRLEGVDLSRERIAFATARAAEQGLSERMVFRVGDARRPPEGTYDLILLDGALHHLAPVRSVLANVARALRPGGVVVVIDFVGPSRFQWSDAQLAAVHDLLATIPEAYRRRWQNGATKRRVYRPGRLSMWVSDPSEAAESSEILSALEAHFDLLELKPLGGSILHLLFKDIAHHYIRPDAAARQILAATFEAEDRALSSGALPSDFVLVVARPRAPLPTAGPR